MAATPQTYTGENASLYIFSGTTSVSHSTLAISDFSLTFDKGTVEQELVGSAGNYRIAGSLSAEGSLSHCKLDGTMNLIGAMVKGYHLKISGNCGPDSLHFFLVSCAVTGFDIDMGDADTITEGSVDFSVMTPYDLSVTDVDGGTSEYKYVTNIG